MFILILFSYVFVLASGSGLTARSPYSLKERHVVPAGWRRIGPAPPYQKINLQISLKQDRFEELESHLYAVSDPSSDRYGQHLSQLDVNELVKPSAEAFDLVHEWLADHGYGANNITYSAAKDRLKISLPVVAVEKLLQTKYSIYRHEDGTRLVRAPAWSLPGCLHEHVSTIQPVNSFFRALPRRQRLRKVPMTEAAKAQMLVASRMDMATASLKDVCNATAIVPNCLRMLYKTDKYTVQAADKNSIGIANYLGEYNNRSDIGIFLSQFRADANAPFQINVTALNGAVDQRTPNTAAQNANGTGLEGNLDAEYVFGITYPTKVQAYNTGGRPPFKADTATPMDANEPYMDWLDFMLGLEQPPQTITTSYGDDEQTVPKSYAIDACNQMAQLGARGVSLFYASGDSGVGDSGSCFTNDGRNKSTFLPSFPASCPYVTVVGATKNPTAEVAAFDENNDFASGGGYSNYFSRPKYQNDVVPKYTESLKGKYKGLFNASGRAYPDVAAQGQRFMVVWGGEINSLDGTSASTPVFASIIGLVNDKLISEGKPPMGFLNPWLYSKGFKAMNDITSGSSMGCNVTGFPAKEGWDPVTGFGTPVSRALHLSKSGC